MTARVHVSNANQRAPTGDRKTVFKSVLDNPYNVPWPHVPMNLQNVVLASLVTILAGVGEYHTQIHAASRKRKRARHDKQRKEKINDRKKRRIDHEKNAPDAPVDAGGSNQEHHDLEMEEEPEAEISLPSPPPVLAHLTFGINEVTKRLESHAKSLSVKSSIRLRKTGITENIAISEVERPSLAYVFVCRADVDPPILVAHFPELVASCNRPIPSQSTIPIHLISLPKQAEALLAEMLGLRRVSVLALDNKTPRLETLSSLLTAIQPPTVPWLTGPAPLPVVSHVPTHIKQLRTSAPKDMRAAKMARKEGRQAAKEKHRMRSMVTTKEKDAAGGKPTTLAKKRMTVTSSRVLTKG